MVCRESAKNEAQGKGASMQAGSRERGLVSREQGFSDFGK